jgi:Tim17/Tim22/Tim23/Pmp24 family
VLWHRNNILNRSHPHRAQLMAVGLGAGGMWGVFEAISKQNQTKQAHAALNPDGKIAPATPRISGKLMLNNVLNHVTRRGPFLGNSAGVLAMTYNLINA